MDAPVRLLAHVVYRILCAHSTRPQRAYLCRQAIQVVQEDLDFLVAEGRLLHRYDAGDAEPRFVTPITCPC